MKNDLFSIGNFTIHGYGLMIAIGIIAAYVMAEYRAKKYKLESQYIFPLLIWGVVIGFVGAKVLYYITVLDEIIADPGRLLDVFDGFVVYGGIIAGIAAGYVFCRVKKLEFWKYLDLVVPSIALAQGFGRIGCFLAGCCYGIETSGPLALTFKDSAFAPNGVALVPTQVYSSIFDFANFAVLCLLARKNRVPGKISALYLIIYSIGRFTIEFFRGDLLRGAIGPLSTSQFISVFVAVFGVILLLRRSAVCNKNK
ncbi:Prolipoprotein diacylglyceryl transferase [uncultured Roseburia sp.]|uniref:Phosphatidylglycerol--prolipoprotein diacylglyceryl transferase n=1 Tax=Brotonthovivens ammoniilytica TaxID=2981725 RepID=A0ABT2TKW5_9FIRM|nr:prolipoprotein diacylglyceryl transferase [Brotonthovivens ammoniilytica]MCU6762840.1 prolipoprotein diacylglyceryl transferase [Brotonthovivens ammoniilytica]SCI90830.1 Prolipoprotein diacylglyceryl transferase [uncultured Roseburia sp.]